jgi:hypothetical protein
MTFDGMTDFYNNGDTIKLITSITKEFYGPMKSKKATYYIDDKKVSETSTFPNTFIYKIDGLSKGTHYLKVKMEYSNDDADGSMETPLEFYVDETPPSFNTITYYKGHEGDYVNGDTLKIGFDISLGTVYKNLYYTKVLLYWDGAKIGEKTSSPFYFEYVLKNQAVGTHKLSWLYSIAGDISGSMSEPQVTDVVIAK